MMLGRTQGVVCRIHTTPLSTAREEDIEMRTQHVTRTGAVVVTGASTGIGRACALHLAALGFQVFAGVRRAEDGDALRAASSDRLTPVSLDVADEASIRAAPETITAAVGAAAGAAGLAGLVNNA